MKKPKSTMRKVKGRGPFLNFRRAGPGRVAPKEQVKPSGNKLLRKFFPHLFDHRQVEK